MRTVCPNCERQLIIADEKIPLGANLKLLCPECKKSFTVSPNIGTGTDRDAETTSPPAIDSPQEPDFFPPGAKIALLVLRDKAWADSLQGLLKDQSFYVTATDDPAQALSKLNVNEYDVVILEDHDRDQPLLRLIHAWPGTRRRKTNVVLIGEEAKSLHPGVSFRKGVDFYFHSQGHAQARALLQAAIEGFDAACQAWRTAAKNLGKEL